LWAGRWLLTSGGFSIHTVWWLPQVQQCTRPAVTLAHGGQDLSPPPVSWWVKFGQHEREAKVTKATEVLKISKDKHEGETGITRCVGPNCPSTAG
jgi:hypothetical protein